LFHQLQSVNRYIELGLFWLVASSTAGFFLLILAGISSRYLLHEPLLSSVELARLLLLWACFLAAALAFRKKGHIGFLFLFDRLPPSIRLPVHSLTLFSVTLFSIFLAYESLSVTLQLWQTRLPMMDISQGWLFLPVPCTSLSVFCFSIEELLLVRRKSG
jgi:TRAP-type C4-dicarboxylate transport system permease small subunit